MPIDAKIVARPITGFSQDGLDFVTGAGAPERRLEIVSDAAATDASLRRRSQLPLCAAPRVDRAERADRPLVVADVALFVGERSGGIRTYLGEKERVARETGLFEHHVVVPGRREARLGGRHEVPGLQLVASSGYRIPYGAGSLRQALRRIQPDVIVLHDPFWRPAGVAEEARRLGAVLVAAHHATPALNAAGVPGPSQLYERVFRRIYHHAYERVDAVMSVVDTVADAGREATIPLRFGIHPAFVPAPGLRKGRVTYAGRLAWEKGVFCLLEAAALSNDPWPLLLVGDGPAKRQIRARIQRLGIEDRVALRDFEPDRVRLAALYRESSCVVQPGPHETFGLVALEAAASGARVVTCDGTPAADVVGVLAETFRAEEPASLLEAIGRARAVPSDASVARRLAESLTWESVFEAEIADLRRLL